MIYVAKPSIKNVFLKLRDAYITYFCNWFDLDSKGITGILSLSSFACRRASLVRSIAARFFSQLEVLFVVSPRWQCLLVVEEFVKD